MAGGHRGIPVRFLVAKPINPSGETNDDQRDIEPSRAYGEELRYGPSAREGRLCRAALDGAGGRGSDRRPHGARSETRIRVVRTNSNEYWKRPASAGWRRSGRHQRAPLRRTRTVFSDRRRLTSTPPGSTKLRAVTWCVTPSQACASPANIYFRLNPTHSRACPNELAHSCASFYPMLECCPKPLLLTSASAGANRDWSSE